MPDTQDDRFNFIFDQSTLNEQRRRFMRSRITSKEGGSSLFNVSRGSGYWLEPVS